MKKYVITGATGMLGSELINVLSKDSIVYAIVRPNSKNINNIKQNDNIICIYASNFEYRNLSLPCDKIDGVFHFAWEGIRNPYRNDEKIQFNNYKYSVDLFDMLKEYRPDFFFGIGSQNEYGYIEGYYKEEIDCNPDSWYGKYKLKLCRFLLKECKKNNIRCIWGRVFSSFGSKDYSQSLIKIAIAKMKTNEVLNLSPCNHIWNYTYSKDIVKAIMLLVEKKCAGIYNITNMENIQLKEYIEKIKKIICSDSILNYGYYKNDDIIPNMLADNTKLVRDTGYAPDYSFETGIKEMLEEMKK